MAGRMNGEGAAQVAQQTHVGPAAAKSQPAPQARLTAAVDTDSAFIRLRDHLR